MKQKKQNNSGDLVKNLRQNRATLPRDYTRCNDDFVYVRHQLHAIADELEAQ